MIDADQHWREHAPKVRSQMVSRFGPDVADDAMGVAAVQLVRCAYRLTHDHAGWLYVVARNAAVTIVQRDARDVALDDDLASHATPQDDVLDRLMALRALRNLKRPHAQAIVAHGLGYSYDDMQALFGWTYCQTQHHMYRGRAAGRKAVAE